MANTNFKVDNGLLVTGGDSLFQANVQVNAHVIVRQTLAVNGDLTVAGNLTFSNTSISGELIPTANGVLLGNTTRTFTVFADNLSLSNSVVNANGTQINIRAGSGIVANTTGISVNASAISNGILNIIQGGTGANNRNDAINSLLPTQNTAVNGWFLRTNGTDVAWISGVGPQGPQGIQGVKGDTGNTGAQGPIGFTGSAGPVAGSNTQVIYNDSNIANGASSLTYNRVTGVTSFGANASLANNYVLNPSFQAYKELVNSISISASTQALDLSLTNIYNLTLNLSTTLSFTNPPASGLAYTVTLHCKQDAIGSKTITWPASVRWPNNSAPVLSTGANKIDILSFFTLDGGTTYVGALALANVG
jgi:hypothetical protein